jgi:hypothetical protein
MSDSFTKILIITITITSILFYLVGSRTTLKKNQFGFTDYGNDPIELTSNNSDIHVLFDSSQNILEMYSGTGQESNSDVLAFSQRVGKNCNIYALKPNNWNDNRSLAILGHEILHCLGATHR